MQAPALTSHSQARLGSAPPPSYTNTHRLLMYLWHLLIPPPPTLRHTPLSLSREQQLWDRQAALMDRMQQQWDQERQVRLGNMVYCLAAVLLVRLTLECSACIMISSSSSSSGSGTRTDR
jgi:hypothetical protein